MVTYSILLCIVVICSLRSKKNYPEFSSNSLRLLALLVIISLRVVLRFGLFILCPFFFLSLSNKMEERFIQQSC